MKKVLIIIAVIVVVIVIGLFSMRSWTKSHSPEEHISYSQGGLDIDIDYCRPYKKGRKIFGKLVPYGEVWRTGANEATVIEFDEDVLIAGRPLESGKYSLWTIPEKSEWTVIFNKETGQWGTNYDAAEDILQVKVPAKKVNSELEQFKIELAGNPDAVDLQLKWDNIQVNVPISKQ